MKIRPCIDIHNGKVKQIVGSSLQDARAGKGSTAKENFVSSKSAEWFASYYREKNLSGGHIILLNSKTDEEAYEQDVEEAVRALKTFPYGMQIGGGITPDNAEEFLNAGASHVIVTSYVFQNGKLCQENLDRMICTVGKEHLVLDLSCRKASYSGEYFVVTDRWQKMTDLTVSKETLDMLSDCCDEFLIHASDVEGKKNGIEERVVRILGDWLTTRKDRSFPVTYAGGVHSTEDVALLKKLSCGMLDVTVGSALDLFGGTLSLDELVEEAEKEAV